MMSDLVVGSVALLQERSLASPKDLSSQIDNVADPTPHHHTPQPQRHLSSPNQSLFKSKSAACGTSLSINAQWPNHVGIDAFSDSII